MTKNKSISNKFPPKTHNYRIVKKYSIKEIFDILGDDSLLVFNKKTLDPYFKDGEYLVKLKRAKIFKEIGTICVCDNCSLHDYHFSLAIDNGGGLHLDLYAYDNLEELNMITIDHIRPKSKGGPNSISNYQTMCKLHNELKSNKIS